MLKVCKRCKAQKQISDFPQSRSNKDGRATICKPCMSARNREYWRTPKGRISQIYSVQRENSKARGHPPPAYTKQELYAWAMEHGFMSLYNTWKAAGFAKNLTPSVDRLDDAYGYTFQNIRLVTWKENNEKMYRDRKSGQRITRQNRKVAQYTLDGRLIAVHPSISHAARVSGATRTNINAMCSGYGPNRQSVAGYIWKYAD